MEVSVTYRMYTGFLLVFLQILLGRKQMNCDGSKLSHAGCYNAIKWRGGEIVEYNTFQAVLIVRYSSDEKLYLYDIQNIKKEARYPSWTTRSDGQKAASSKEDCNTLQNELQDEISENKKEKNKKETSSPSEQ